MSARARMPFTFHVVTFIRGGRGRGGEPDPPESALSSGGALLQLADAHVAQGQRAFVVALDRDVPLLRAPIVRPVLELAGLHLRFPVRAPELVFHDLLP